MPNFGSQTQSIQQKAYLYIRAKILSGELQPGAALSEASLARELGNSRGPLREAVRQLTAEGFLRQTPKGGSVVVEFSRRDVEELYDLREALEVYAVGKAAEHLLRPVDLENLQRAVGEILVLRDELENSGRATLNTEGMKRFLALDLQFHTTLVRAAANTRILKAFADTRVLLNIFALRRQGHEPAQLTEIHRFHNEILAAVVNKDPALATGLLGEHIRISKMERLREYDDRERDPLHRHPVLELL
jgi:DNA-binding GntR family transcriptional regulator